MVNVKIFFSSQMPKLVNGLMSNIQLMLPDDDNRTEWCGEQLPP